MTEWKLFEGKIPFVSTPEFHEHRERARHLEQADHRDRLLTAAEFVRTSSLLGPLYSDLGCGDGGLLSITQSSFEQAWGYDFQPSNSAGWAEREITAYQADVFSMDRDSAILGDVVSCTEVLEHLADPHEVVRWIHDDPLTKSLVCSSPVNETDMYHDECHAWAWDFEGYSALVSGGGWHIEDHRIVGRFQVVRATA